MDLRSKMFFPPVAGQWLPDGVSSRVSGTGLQVNTISGSSSILILIILTPILVQPDARVLAMGGGEKANFQRDEIRHGEHVPGDCNVNFDYLLHDPVSRRCLYVVRY